MRSLPTSLSHLPKALAKMEDDRVEVQDPLKKVNLGTKDNPKPLFISKLLSTKIRTTIIALLSLYKDNFVRDYTEMPSLGKDF